jgi:hypothetical protein
MRWGGSEFYRVGASASASASVVMVSRKCQGWDSPRWLGFASGVEESRERARSAPVRVAAVIRPVAGNAARPPERKRMLKFAQLRCKAEFFAEITRNYPAIADMRGGWEIEKFDFNPPSDGWMAAFKPLTTFELALESIPQFDKFDVWISGTTPKGDTKKAKVGTIANRQ